MHGWLYSCNHGNSGKRRTTCSDHFLFGSVEKAVNMTGRNTKWGVFKVYANCICKWLTAVWPKCPEGATPPGEAYTHGRMDMVLFLQLLILQS